MPILRYSAQAKTLDTVQPSATEQAELDAANARAASEARIREIKGELAALDRWFPRAVEDIIEAEEVMGMASIDGAVTTYDKLSEENQARLAQKRALRAELAALENQG